MSQLDQVEKDSGVVEVHGLPEQHPERLIFAGVAAGLLSACGGGSSSNPATGGSEDTTSMKNRYRNVTSSSSSSLAEQRTSVDSLKFPAVRIRSEIDAARFLAQAGFGGNQAERLALMGGLPEQWIITQFATPQGISRWDEATRVRTADPTSFSVAWEMTDNILWKPIATYPDVLRQRMALALSEIFVVNSGGADLPGYAKPHAICGYMDMLEKHAFGNFRSLLEAVSLSVPMGRMLGTLGNQKEDPKTNRRPDENYAREVMQLFTIGLYQLNTDGTIKIDGAGKPIESYTIDDVSNLARVFTGWSTKLNWTDPVFDIEPYRQPMTLTPSLHSTMEKKFLGVTIPTGTDGASSMKIALDTLFNHPNVGPFIGKQLIQRFVTSNPSPAYVARVSAAFANNGQGVRGDFKAILKAILLDAEARIMPSDMYAGKGVEPMIRVGTLFRGLKFTSPDGMWRLYRAADFGQQPMNAPSVFNFFRPGYVPPNTSLASSGKVAPELQLMNEQSVLSLANTITKLLNDVGGYTRRSYYETVSAVKTYKQDAASTGLTLDLSHELAMVNQPEQLVKHLNLLLVAGQLSMSTQQFIVTSISKMMVIDADPVKLKAKQINRVNAAILMVLMAPEAQVLK